MAKKRTNIKIDASSGVKVNDSKVVTPDVAANNGVIHTVDASFYTGGIDHSVLNPSFL